MIRKRGTLSAEAIAMVLFALASSNAYAQAQFLQEAQYLHPVGSWFLPFLLFGSSPGFRSVHPISTTSCEEALRLNQRAAVNFARIGTRTDKERKTITEWKGDHDTSKYTIAARNYIADAKETIHSSKIVVSTLNLRISAGCEAAFSNQINATIATQLSVQQSMQNDIEFLNNELASIGARAADERQSQPTSPQPAPPEPVHSEDDMNRNIDNACAGKNPDALRALKALGIGCNGEKLTPAPNAKFANQAAETFYESARQQPDFRVSNECEPGAPCQRVETATRSPDRNGESQKDTFITFEDGSEKKIWCSQNTRDLYRLCVDAADGSDEASAKSWVEAYFPIRHHWVRIELDNPACKDQQQSKYDIDNAYVTCIVAKFDAP